jgi:ribosomal protein S18 acetylase RimI-like enzyme
MITYVQFADLGPENYTHLQNLEAQDAGAHASRWLPAYSKRAGLLGLACLKNQIPVGYVAHTQPVVGSFDILMLMVHPDHRRQGHGRGLVRALIDNYKDHEIFLDVRTSNINAQNLYQSLGFVQVGQRIHYYPDQETALVYRYSSIHS